MTDQPTDQTPQTPEEARAAEDRLVRERRDKAERMRADGIDLYVHRFIAKNHAAELHEKYPDDKMETEQIDEQEVFTVAGRVMLVRSFGKAGFITLDDETGRIQVYVKSGVTDEAGFNLFKKWLDAGDIVGATGTLFRTKTKELTIHATELKLLTKSMRPLPEKWHGLKDVEQRYRRRYVDLITNPDVRETFRLRSRAIAFIRRFLDQRGYMEVETPMMQAIYGGAAAKPFVTHHNALDMDLYLRIAPELFLKRLIAGGYERVYEINRNFRNEGVSTRHNPEFTMLELYTAGWNYQDTMTLTEELIRGAAQEVLGKTTVPFNGHEIDLGSPFRRLRILDAIAELLGLGSNHKLKWGLKKEELYAILREKYGKYGEIGEGEPFTVKGEGFNPEQEYGHTVAACFTIISNPASSDECLINIFETFIESTLAQPTFIMDYPKSLCPLTKSSAADPAMAERFEMFIGGLEMANAYSELNDPDEQQARFEDQVNRRKAGDEEAMNEVDYDYVRALEYGMAPCSGLGIGIDRLIMLLTNSASIRDVILFPLMRPEK
ncbi:lysine--tRNA ligase [bacterium]|nr:lysine--tRNA ligase [bacterium]